MKVALTGPACSGKSTLLRDLEQILKKRGYKVKVFHEIARDLIKESKHLQMHKLEIKLFRMYLRRYEQMKDADIYLLDRDLPDVLFYTLLYDRNPDMILLAEEIESAIYRHHADVYLLLSPLENWNSEGRLALESEIKIREWEFLFWRDWLFNLFPRDVFIVDIDMRKAGAGEVANLVELYFKILKKKNE